MNLDINVQQENTELLTEEELKELAQKLNDLWKKGEEARKKTIDRKKKLVKAYECQHEQIILKRTGSKAFLPWVYTAHESAQARLSSSLVPNDEDYFSLNGETEDDQKGADVMSEYMKAVYNQMGFDGKADDAIKEWLFGEVCGKLTWRKDETRYTGKDGQPVTEYKYNNVYLEIIPSEDFIIYPISGDLSRSSYGHRIWRHKDELLAVQEQGYYINVDTIEESTDRDQSGDCNKDTDHQGLEVKEFYLHRVKLGKRVFRNMVATMVEGKTILRFEQNQNDYDFVPFIYCPFIKDQGKNSGHGLTDRAYEIQKMANFIINQVFDESKIKLFGFYKYVDDNVFNPAGFVARPAGLVKVGQMDNLQPVNPNIGQLSFGITELQYLQNEFETTTGVPKFLTGVRDQETGKDTATAKRLAADGADTRFRMFARRFNSYFLKPLVAMSYAMIRQMAMIDPTVLKDIARRTQKGGMVPQTDDAGQPMTGLDGQPIMRPITDEDRIAQLPDIPSLTKVDIKIVGFENVLDKADKAAQFERFVQGVAGMAQYDPSLLEHIKPDNALDYYARQLSIDSDLMRTEQEFAEYQQQKQMAAQQEQQNKLQVIQLAARQGIDPKMLMAA